MHRQLINSCLSRSICFFATSSPQFFNFWQSFAWCSRKSLFLISHSPYKLILSRLWLELLIALMKSNVWISLSQIFISTSASASYDLCRANFSPLTAKSAFRSRILWRFCLSLNVCTTFRSRSLFSFDTDSKRLETTVSRSMTCNRITIRQHLREATPWCTE